MDTLADGEYESDPASGVCISYAARRQSDSPGMTRLDAMPSVTMCTLCENPLTCSSQPPMKATPCRPSTSTPLVSVENQVPNRKVRARANTHSNTMGPKPRTGCSGSTPVVAWATQIVAPNVTATYATIMPTNPRYLPTRICHRAMGLVAMA